MTARSHELETLGFPVAYDVEVPRTCEGSFAIQNFGRSPPSCSPDGLVGNVPTKHHEIAIKVTHHNGETWTGTFSPGLEGVTSILATPDPDVLCVINAGEGYWVPIRAPASYHIIQCVPIKFTRALPQLERLIFGSSTKLVAYGRQGPLWSTARLSWDGLEISEVDERAIHGLGWDAPGDRKVPFTVDLVTGKHEGGSSPEMYL